MYLETMERVLGGMSKTILDAPGASPPVPYLALEPSTRETGGSAEMRNPFSSLGILIAVVVAIVVASYTFFTVDPTEQALVLRFGQPVGDLISEPGLHVKVPFVDSVVYIDKRILALDNPRQEVLVAENLRLDVDAFVRYRIDDPLRFYRTVLTVQGANAQLSGMLNSALRNTLSDASVADIVRNKRETLMGDIRDTVKKGAERFGINVVDVRIKRADLVPENSDAVFRSMQAERQLRAAKIRAEGVQESQSITSKADRDVIVVKAQAQQQAEQIRGEGDAERNKIFADAYGADPEFFAFYRSMQAYDDGLQGRHAGDPQPEVGFLPLFQQSGPGPAPPRRRRPPPQ